MALGGPVVRQHYVEFIRGTGVKLDGVVDGTSTNGPWTWIVPKDVTQIFVVGVGAGGGGGGASSSKGAGAAGSGAGAIFLKCAVAPGTSLTVTVGAKGTGGSTSSGTAGGNSTITNLVSSPIDNPTTLELKGGVFGNANGTGGSSGWFINGSASSP